MANYKINGENVSGIKMTWGVTLRDKDGELIVRMATIQPPAVPQCLRLKCLLKYWRDATLFALVATYHTRRVEHVKNHYFYADAVESGWRIRKAGLDPTGQKFPYEKGMYQTYEDATKKTRKIGARVLERYRTGEPSPQTIWQAIHANIKLRCPVCRKYNRDPLLGRTA